MAANRQCESKNPHDRNMRCRGDLGHEGPHHFQGIAWTSDDPFDVLRTHLGALDRAMTRLVEEELLDWQEKNLPDDIRSTLLTMGASISDYVLWVRKRPQEGDLSDRPDDQMYWAEEMEAGTGAWGVTAREALDHYLSDDLLDRRRWVHHRGLDTTYPDDEPSNRRSGSAGRESGEPI